MRLEIVVLASIVVVVAPLIVSGGEKPDREAEVKWAHEIVDDYFDTTFHMFRGDGPKATGTTRGTSLGLLSPELAKFEEQYWGESVTRRICYEFGQFEITKTEVGPDGSEIVFRGIL